MILLLGQDRLNLFLFSTLHIVTIWRQKKRASDLAAGLETIIFSHLVAGLGSFFKKNRDFFLTCNEREKSAVECSTNHNFR